MLSKQEVLKLLRNNKNKHYAYELYRPDKEYIFYVGKGSGKRIFVHEYTTSLDSVNKYKNNIIKKLLKNKIDLKYIIHFFDSEIEAYAKEESLIKKYGRKDLKTGLLTNRNDGGFIHSNISEEVGLLISNGNKKSYKDNPNRARSHSVKMTRLYQNRPELKEQKRQQNLKRFEDKKEREKASLAMKKRFSDPKEREKQSISGKKRFEDPKEREKVSLKGKKNYQENPDRAKKHSEFMKKYYKNSENRAKTGKASKKVFKKNPELIQKLSERSKKYNQQRQLVVRPVRERCKMFLIENKISHKYYNGRIYIKERSIHLLSGIEKWLEFEEYLLTLI